MTIRVFNTSVSVPNGIADWVRQSDDNMTEFNGLIESIINATKEGISQKNETSTKDTEELYKFAKTVFPSFFT